MGCCHTGRRRGVGWVVLAPCVLIVAWWASVAVVVIVGVRCSVAGSSCARSALWYNDPHDVMREVLLCCSLSLVDIARKFDLLTYGPMQNLENEIFDAFEFGLIALPL